LVKLLTNKVVRGNLMPSLFSHCWMGIKKSIRPVKNWVMDTGVVICLECGANDLHMVQYATATSSSLTSVQCRMVYLSDGRLPKLSWKNGC